MAKTNISMPDGMLEDVDRRATDAGVTRSGFIQEAIAHYATALDTEQARAERSERIGKAIELARSLASKVGAPDSAKLIREIRDEPPRWMKP
jgi:metal-responsive CopG/Arc/MetJ family transcriptional regulator